MVHLDVGACRVNLIDTPGYPDFAGRALSVLEAVETAAIVVSAVNGIEPVTQRMMEFARDRELCRLIVINKIDSKDARTSRCSRTCAKRSAANACR
jgi:elongation factor G